MELRIGKAERDAAVERLNAHLDAERITLAEHDERVTQALEARINADLNRLFVDLPSLEPERPAPERRRAKKPPRAKKRRRASIDWKRLRWEAACTGMVVGVIVLWGLWYPLAVLAAIAAWIYWPQRPPRYACTRCDRPNCRAGEVDPNCRAGDYDPYRRD